MIRFTQGDTVVLNLTANDGNGNPITLTGATFTTYIRGANGVNITFPNSQHTANADQVNFKGQFTLSLSSTDTGNIPIGINKEIVTVITLSASPVAYRGPNILTVMSINPVA